MPVAVRSLSGLFLGGGTSSLLAMLAPSGCSRTAAPASTSLQPIVIGVSLGLATGGDLASLAGPMANGVRVAESQVNAAGGLLGRPVQFRIVDDQSDSSTGKAKGAILQSAIGGLLDAGALSILGPVGSQQVADVQMEIAQKQVLQISASATAIALADAQPPTHRYFFRTVASDQLQGKAIALFATAGAEAGASGDDAGDGAVATPSPTPDAGVAGHAACRNMAIVTSNDAYGEGLGGAVAANMAALGATVVTQFAIPTAIAASYATQVSQIMAATPTPDCLGLFMYSDVSSALVRDLATARAMNPNALASTFFVVGGDGLYDSGLLQGGLADPSEPSSKNTSNGIFGTSPDSTPPTQEYNSFRQLYNASFPLEAGVDTAQYVSNLYDAAILTVLAIEQAGTVSDPAKVRDSLYSVSSVGTSYGPAELTEALLAIRQGVDIDYTGASGTCDFDSEGNVISNYIVWQVQNGQFSTVSRIQDSDLK